VRFKRLTVRISDEPWKIIFKKPTEDDYIGVEDDDIGLCVAEDRKIFVSIVKL